MLNTEFDIFEAESNRKTMGMLEVAQAWAKCCNGDWPTTIKIAKSVGVVDDSEPKARSVEVEEPVPGEGPPTSVEADTAAPSEQLKVMISPTHTTVTPHEQADANLGNKEKVKLKTHLNKH